MNEAAKNLIFKPFFLWAWSSIYKIKIKAVFNFVILHFSVQLFSMILTMELKKIWIERWKSLTRLFYLPVECFGGMICWLKAPPDLQVDSCWFYWLSEGNFIDSRLQLNSSRSRSLLWKNATRLYILKAPLLIWKVLGLGRERGRLLKRDFEKNQTANIYQRYVCIPSWHTTLFQRPANVHNVHITLYKSWDNVVCQLG